MRRLPLILAACQLALGQDLSIFQSGISNDSIQAIYQGDRGYADASRPFNLRYASVSPAAIVYPNSADDVSSILQAAMAANISAQAKSGGHSYATLAERNDSITINLRNMRAINVDSSSGIASIESGNHLGDVALALWEQGQRALPHVSNICWGFPKSKTPRARNSVESNFEGLLSMGGYGRTRQFRRLGIFEPTMGYDS